MPARALRSSRRVRPRCSGRAVDQAQSAYEHVVNGYTREEREIAVANVQKAIADIEAVQSIIDQMVVYAPVPSQDYKR
jgi:HlyD family secretion protein